MLARMAVGLRDEVVSTGSALAAGTISLGQARVIDAAIHILSKDLPEAALVEGEQILLDQAKTHDPVGPTGIGEQLFAVLDPAGYQRAQEDKLERAERGAYAERGFTLTADMIGSGSLIGAVAGSVRTRSSPPRWMRWRRRAGRMTAVRTCGVPRPDAMTPCTSCAGAACTPSRPVPETAARSNCGSPCRLRSSKADFPVPGRC